MRWVVVTHSLSDDRTGANQRDQAPESREHSCAQEDHCYDSEDSIGTFPMLQQQEANRS